MPWIIDKIRDILPNRPYGKTARDTRVARLIDLNRVIDSVNQGFENLSGPSYKVYTALLSQIGTDDPVATVLENTIGDIVWTRIGVGNFRGTLASAFTLNKTIAFPEADIQQTPNMSVLTFGTIDENTVVIQSLNNLIIGDEFAGWIEIRVYN